MKAYVEISHDSTANELQTVLDVIYAWATEWQLQVSVEKCAILEIGYVSDNNVYYITKCQSIKIYFPSNNRKITM